jgi:hypothetical protein
MASSKDYSKEDPAIKRIFDNISTTIIFISQAYAHFNAYSFGDFSEEELPQVRNEIFTFQNIASQFFLVVQFCKLMDKSGKSDEAESSLYKLNNILRDTYTTDFNRHSENVKLLKEIGKRKIYLLMSTLRNKNYGHSDNHPLNIPLRFIFLKKNEINEFYEIFLNAIKVFENCYHLYDVGISFQHFYNSSSPKNFLKGYFRYKKFWFEHHRGK